MPIRQSITEAPPQPSPDDPATIRRLTELLKDDETELCVRELIRVPGLVGRMQTLADHGNTPARRVMVTYRWRKFGTHPTTGAELGPQTGPLP